MAVRLRIPPGLWSRPYGRALLITALSVVLLSLGAGLLIWFHFKGIIDARLKGQVFESRSAIFTAPEPVRVGEKRTRDDLLAQLRRFGYSNPDQDSSVYGQYRLSPASLEIRPGPASRVGTDQAARIEFGGGRITRIVSLANGAPRDAVWVDPPLLTNLFDNTRTKRRLVVYEEIPPNLINAVLAAEDRRFFSHPGISLIDILRAIWADVRAGAPVQGGSTLTMQLSRSFFLTPSRTLKRKAAEAIIAIQLERRLTKEQIFELYANEVYLGQRGSFSIRGFGEAARAYFDKDITQLSLPECALLAGILPGPSLYSPFRNADRALTRRNYVLDSMAETGAIQREEAGAAKKSPLRLAPANFEASEAPYYVDLVRDHLLEKRSEEELISQSYRIYGTLDLRLQDAAAAAVREALPEVDAKINARYKRSKQRAPEVQVTLIALDPRTGAIKALVGGRDYTRSQLNRATAPRQPGSAFKPFVYAAAFATGLTDPEHALTPITTVVDEPTVFEFEGQEYQPSNFGEKFLGVVTLREALVNSLNVATVKVAQRTGYAQVAETAVESGLNPRVRPTPAIALGAYDSSPLEVAGAYTVFVNYGRYVAPALVSSVVANDGRVLEQTVPQARVAMDPRVAYLVVDLLEDNINRGTGAGARARGFAVPAAGKTGTSRDAWFAGFTSSLVCVVWVGFDDGRDLGLPGSTAALPVWTAFMKRAVALSPYKNTEEFIPPEGIVSVPLDADTLFVATPACTNVRYERFILGTEPRELCPLHRPNPASNPVARTLLRLFGVARKKDSDGDSKPPSAPATEAQPSAGAPPRAAAPSPPGNLLEAYFGPSASKREQPSAASPDSKKPKKKAGARAGGG